MRYYYEIQAEERGQWASDLVGTGRENQFDSEEEAEAALANLLETNPRWAIGDDGEPRGYRVRMVEDPRG